MPIDVIVIKAVGRRNRDGPDRPSTVRIFRVRRDHKRISVLHQLGYLAMPPFGVPRRSLNSSTGEPTQFNWRRGIFRLWLLMSAAWIMSWVIYLIMNVLEEGLKAIDFLVMPILLMGPPVALLIFGAGARWACRGFTIEDSSSKE